MMDGMTGAGSFTATEMNIMMTFANSRHARIAQYHNIEGIRSRRGNKIRHFLYLSKNDIRAIMRVVAKTLGFRLVTG